MVDAIILVLHVQILLGHVSVHALKDSLAMELHVVVSKITFHADLYCNMVWGHL